MMGPESQEKYAWLCCSERRGSVGSRGTWRRPARVRASVSGLPGIGAEQGPQSRGRSRFSGACADELAGTVRGQRDDGRSVPGPEGTLGPARHEYDVVITQVPGETRLVPVTTRTAELSCARRSPRSSVARGAHRLRHLGPGTATPPNPVSSHENGGEVSPRHCGLVQINNIFKSSLHHTDRCEERVGMDFSALWGLQRGGSNRSLRLINTSIHTAL